MSCITLLRRTLLSWSIVYFQLPIGPVCTGDVRVVLSAKIACNLTSSTALQPYPQACPLAKKHAFFKRKSKRNLEHRQVLALDSNNAASEEFWSHFHYFLTSEFLKLLLTHRCVHSVASPRLCRQYELRTPQANSTYRSTRRQIFSSICLPSVTRCSGELTPLYTSTLLYRYNNLPSELRSPNISFSLFRCTIMKYLGTL